MAKGLLLLHYIATIAFTIYVVEFYDEIHAAQVCDKLAECRLTFNASITAAMLCPSAAISCVGDEECCTACELQPGARRIYRYGDVLSLRSRIVIRYARTALISQVVVCGVLFSIILLLTITTILADVSPKRLILLRRITVVMFACIVLELPIAVLFGIIALLVDFDYYRSCQSNGVVICAWSGIAFVTLLTVITNGGLRIYRRFSRPHNNSSGIHQEYAGRRFHRDGLWVSFGSCVSKLLSIVLALGLCAWIMIFVYFIGIGQGTWKPFII